MWYSFLRTVFEGNCIMEDVLSPYDRAYPADTRKPKAHCCSRYEADSKVTGAHRVNRPLPYGTWRDYISCEIRNGLTGLERRW